MVFLFSYLTSYIYLCEARSTFGTKNLNVLHSMFMNQNKIQMIADLFEYTLSAENLLTRHDIQLHQTIVTRNRVRMSASRAKYGYHST